MSTDRDTTRIVRSWLEEGVTALPDRVLDTVLDQVPATPQRRPTWSPRRFAPMNRLFLTASAAAAVLVVVIIGYNLLPRTGGVGTQPTVAPSPSSSPTSPGSASNPLVGTWLAREVTCAEQVATIGAAGYTAEQVAQAGADLVAQGYGQDGFFDCSNQASGARTTSRYSIVFDGLPLAAKILSVRIYDYGALNSPNSYGLIGDSTFEFGGRAGGAWEWCLTFRYTIDGDVLTLDRIDPSCTGTGDAPLLDQIALTAILETASFTRQP
ncbi:MAG: hypothetical protein M3O77_06005 [Chloroflexota bacterium]|nr:hypothetical protein [Chloroflexota bacterium]